MYRETKADDQAFGYGVPGDEKSGWYPENIEGLTKREYFAANLPIDFRDLMLEPKSKLIEFVGRNVDFTDSIDILKALAVAEAKIRVMKADALIEELNK